VIGVQTGEQKTKPLLVVAPSHPPNSFIASLFVAIAQPFPKCRPYLGRVHIALRAKFEGRPVTNFIIHVIHQFNQRRSGVFPLACPPCRTRWPTGPQDLNCSACLLTLRPPHRYPGATGPRRRHEPPTRLRRASVRWQLKHTRQNAVVCGEHPQHPMPPRLHNRLEGWLGTAPHLFFAQPRSPRPVFQRSVN